MASRDGGHVMKNNLAGFRVDPILEKEGVWVMVRDQEIIPLALDQKPDSEELKEYALFKISMLGARNQVAIKAIHAKHHKPYARQIEMKTLSEEKMAEIFIKIFVEACLKDWKNVRDDQGKDIPYSEVEAIKLFTEYSELVIALNKVAMSPDFYRGDLGNY